MSFEIMCVLTITVLASYYLDLSGYNDSKIRPWNAAATEKRSEFAFTEKLEYALQIADEYGPSAVPFLSITSYNEWGEGTQVVLELWIPFFGATCY